MILRIWGIPVSHLIKDNVMLTNNNLVSNLTYFTQDDTRVQQSSTFFII